MSVPRLRTPLALAAACLSLAAAGGARAAATTTITPPPNTGSYCGQTISVIQPRPPAAAPAPLALGDSVLYDAAGPLSALGFQINAMVCRTMQQGIAFLQQNQQNLPSLVVVALGTNGSVSSDDIEVLLGLLGPNRALALVTPHGGDYPAAAGLYRAAARADPARVKVLDWAALSATQPDWFASDGIHLQGAGINAYAQLVSTALVDLPAPTMTSTTPAPTATGQATAAAPTPAGPVAASAQTPTVPALARAGPSPSQQLAAQRHSALVGVRAAALALARMWDAHLSGF